MAEYRICEFCDHPNDPSFLVCENCGADIYYISPQVIDEHVVSPEPIPEGETEKDQPSTPPASETGNTTVHRNTGQGTEPRRTAVFNTLKLVSSRDNVEVELPIEGGVIGREGDICQWYFMDQPYVSARHARLFLRGTDYIVVDNNSTNRTKLNGLKLEPGREYVLKVGDRITFANLEFIVEPVT